MICCIATYHGEGMWSFCVSLCMYSFLCASGIILCTPACPAMLVWLCLKYKGRAHKSTCYRFAYKDKTTTQLPYYMQHSMSCSFIQSRNQAVTGHLSGKQQDQYSRWRHGTIFLGQWTLYHVSHVLLRMRKRVSTLNLKIKAVLRQNIKKNFRKSIKQINLFAMA